MKVVHKATDVEVRGVLRKKPRCRITGRASDDWVIADGWDKVTCLTCRMMIEKKKQGASE